MATRRAWFGSIASVALACTSHADGLVPERAAPAVAPQAGPAGPVAEAKREETPGSRPEDVKDVPPEATPEALPPVPGVSLQLKVTPAVWKPGVEPKLALAFVNESSAAIKFVSPLDGSWDGMREPTYAIELLDEGGAPVDGVFGPPLGRCGMTNALVPADDVITLGAGGRQDAAKSRNSFAFYQPIGEVARPGRYRARVRYRSTLAEATRMEVVSNPVEVEIRGTNMDLWTCWKEQVDAGSNYRAVGSAPVAAAGFGEQWAVLVQRREEGIERGIEVRDGEIQLHVVDAAGPQGWSPIARGDLARPRMVGLGEGAWIVFGPGRGEGPRALTAVVVRPREGGGVPDVGAPQELVRDSANAYVLAIASAGEGAAALYLAGQDEAAALQFQAVDARGARVGEPVPVVQVPSHVSSVQLAGDGARGYLAVWTQGTDIVVAPLGPRGESRAEAIVLGEHLGAPQSVWPAEDGGFRLAYHKNYMLGSNSRDTMGFYLQAYDASGRASGSRVALSRASAEQSSFGGFAAGPGGGARAYERERRAGERRRPSELLFAPLGEEARPIASTLLGEPWIAAVRGGYVVMWADSRDDASQVCSALGECVGEAYVSIWREGQAMLGPTRLTRDARSKPRAASGGDWRALCP